jgi:hypothetical protein
MGRITDSYSGKQKFIIGPGRKGNEKLDEYQNMLLKEDGKVYKTNTKKRADSKHTYDTLKEKCKICQSWEHYTNEHWTGTRKKR